MNEFKKKENKPNSSVATEAVADNLVEHWPSNPEDAGSIPSRKALELHFSQLVPVWVL